MSTEQAGKLTTEPRGSSGPGSSQIESEEAGLMTPWLRRRFGLGPTSGEPAGSSSRRSAGVATERIRTWLARIRSAGERTRAWKPDIGSLRPELVQQFSRAVARRHERFPLVSVQRGLAAPMDPWQDETELTLPTGARPEETPTSAAAGKLKGPSIFSAGQPIPRLSPRAPTAGRTASPSRSPSRSATRAQRLQPPPRSRLFARVEEVTSAGRELSSEAEETAPLPREMDLQPQQPAADTALQDAEPDAGGEQPSPTGAEPAPSRGQPTVQRKIADTQTAAPPRRQARRGRSQKPPAGGPPVPPPIQMPGEPQVPPADTTVAPDEPEPETEDRQAAEELPLRPPPAALTVPPSRPRVQREPGPRQSGPRHPDAADASPSVQRSDRAAPRSRPPRGQAPVRGEQDGVPSDPSRAPEPPAALAPPEQPEVPRKEQATKLAVSPEVERSQDPEEESPSAPSLRTAEPALTQGPQEEPVDRPKPGKPGGKAVAASGERTEGEPAEEMALRQPMTHPQAIKHPADEPAPVTGPRPARSAPRVQRQVLEAADTQSTPVLSPDGRRILARTRSRARATLTKLPATRHRPPEARPTPAGAAQTLHQRPAAGRSIFGRSQRRRSQRTNSLTLFGRSPDVQIGPDSSLLLTRWNPEVRPQREPGSGQRLEHRAPAMPAEVRAMLSAPERRTEGTFGDAGLPLPRVPSSAAPRGASIQRAKTDSEPTRHSSSGGRPEPPRLPPPPPPEEPSLPLARPPAPRPTGEQVRERTSETQDVVHRVPDGPVGTLQREATVVQMARGDGEPWDEIDLPDLARRVFPVIKRMLSIERERTRGRSL